LNKKKPNFNRDIINDDVELGLEGLEASWRDWRGANTPIIDEEAEEGHSKRYPKEYVANKYAQTTRSTIMLSTLSDNLTGATIEIRDGASSSSSIKYKTIASLFIILLTIIPALLIPKVASVWSILGSSIGLNVAFVTPSLCYIVFAIQKKLHMDYLVVLSWILFIASSTLMSILTIYNIYSVAIL
jgi:hypothetical protein